ncbi:MAG: hypothetical protein ACYDFU_00115 [Nitrospirota bacterium]
MRKTFAYVVIFAGLLVAGTVYAAMSGSDMYRSGMSSSNPQVKAAVVSKSGDTIRLYAPDNSVLCKGDEIPVFRTSTMAERLLPSSNSDSAMNKIIAKADLSKARLIGEVRVERLIGTNLAEGKLIVGEAAHGDIATKPSAQCLSTRG